MTAESLAYSLSQNGELETRLFYEARVRLGMEVRK